MKLGDKLISYRQGEYVLCHVMDLGEKEQVVLLANIKDGSCLYGPILLSSNYELDIQFSEEDERTVNRFIKSPPGLPGSGLKDYTWEEQ